MHGWGYDATLWDAVRAALPDHREVVTLDMGFFGPEKVGVGKTGALAVGHSLGALWWLVRAPDAWDRLLCINGFPRFTETSGYVPAVAPRVLDRMRQRFRRDPASVLADFHARCGGHAPRGTPDVARLAAGLDALADWDGRAALDARRAAVRALSGSEDPIVPEAMSTLAFGAHERIDAPGHLLPITHPEVCAAWIERLAQ